jgi:hypothetical protein
LTTLPGAGFGTHENQGSTRRGQGRPRHTLQALFRFFAGFAARDGGQRELGGGVQHVTFLLGEDRPVTVRVERFLPLFRRHVPQIARQRLSIAKNFFRA